MCGIFAAVGQQLSQPMVERTLETLHHRGPDGRGVFVDSGARLTIGHTRLAVLDIVTGAQPMQSDDGSLILSCNGEIYDFERIRASLEAKGYHFKTRSDSEVILYLYAEYGLGCFEHLRGEFAFLLYDKAKRRLIAARDRFGIKPLYRATLDGGAVFASEMKAIFATGLVTPRLNAAAFDPFAPQDPLNPRLPFEGIEHVPPGCYVTLDLRTGASQVLRYWSAEIPAQSAEPVTEPTAEQMHAAAGAVLDGLDEAVRLRLRADVPVGLYLSGGIDSSFVGALMRRHVTGKLHSFSISFVASDRDERDFALKAARVLGTEHHELAVTRQMLWDHLDDALWFSELPFVTLAPVGKFLLSATARKHVTAVLTGEGADELFLGYRSFFRDAIRDTRNGGGVRRGSLRHRRLKMGALAGSVAERLSLRLVRKNRRAALIAARRAPIPQAADNTPLINAVQEGRIAGMPFDILCFLGDREEMAHSLEARLPFLDHHLYDLARQIPVDLKFRDGVEKAVLRDAAKALLPDELRLRRKAGFMLTSESVDLFGADRGFADKYDPYLSKQAFDEAGVFSYRAYRLLRRIARFPAGPRFRHPRENANKAIMVMLQVHLLHQMFIADPRWERTTPPASVRVAA
jgi:asparagine synthase (glutamine-hydrolysing)